MNKNTINSSVAKCLGSLVVTEHLLDLYHEKNYNIYSELVNDKEAVNACLQFCGRFQCMIKLFKTGASLTWTSLGSLYALNQLYFV